MKKLLSLLGSITMIATPGATVIACGESSSTTTNLDQDAVTKADYSIAAKNLSSGASLEALDDEALTEVFQKHLIGYINPILKKLINRNVSDLEKQYIIEGLNIEQVKSAIKEVIENGKKTIPITGVTIRAKNAASDIRGKTTLGNVNVVVGRSISEVYNGENAKINIPIKDLDPTEAEIISYFNEHAKEDIIKEVKEIRAGHLTFNKVQRRNRVTILGQGYFYDQIEAWFDSAKATNIEAIIKQRDLGEIKFDDGTSKEEQILTIVNENAKKENPNFQDLTQEDVLISNITDKGANIEGVRLYKGSVDLEWESVKTDLSVAISDKHLGANNGLPSLDRIVNVLNQKNEGLNISKDDLNDPQSNIPGKVTIIANASSGDFKGSVDLTWAETKNLIVEIELAEKALQGAINTPTEEVRKDLEDAIKNAKSISTDINISQTGVDDATNSLKQSIERFKEATKTNLQPLKEKIEEANKIIAEHEDANEILIQDLKSAISEAKAVLENPLTTEKEASDSVALLTKAIEKFNEAISSNKVNLGAKINEANKKLQELEGVDKSQDALLKEEIKKAQAIFDDLYSTQESIDSATKSLDDVLVNFSQKVNAKASEIQQRVQNGMNEWAGEAGIIDLGVFPKQKDANELKRLMMNKFLEKIRALPGETFSINEFIWHKAPSEDQARNGIKGWDSGQTIITLKIGTNFKIVINCHYKLSVQ